MRCVALCYGMLIRDGGNQALSVRMMSQVRSIPYDTAAIQLQRATMVLWCRATEYQSYVCSLYRIVSYLCRTYNFGSRMILCFPILQQILQY